jgi:hypothetical protein
MQKALSAHLVEPEVVAELTQASQRATTMAGLDDF